MKKLANRLVMVLLILVIISTILTTAFFFQLEKKVYLTKMRQTDATKGTVGITIINDNLKSPETQTKKSSGGSGDISIKLINNQRE